MAFGHVLSWAGVAPVAELIPDRGGAEMPPLAGRADPWIYGLKNRSNVPDVTGEQVLARPTATSAALQHASRAGIEMS